MSFPQPASTTPARALTMSTIAFTICIAAWTVFSIIGVRIKQELGLKETQFGLLVGAPILTGSLVRMLLGIWTDRYGGRLVLTATMLAAAVATFLLSHAETRSQILVAALSVGMIGGSFAVGVASLVWMHLAILGMEARAGAGGLDAHAGTEHTS
jgi:NNP family nitrate/nitrite transporter-like MFS transporter